MENSMEQTQKINNLARELIKNKIVTSAEEAYKRAESTVRMGQKVETPESDMQKDLRQFRVALSDAIKYLKEEDDKIIKLKAEVETLRMDLQNARSDISQLKMKAREAPVVQRPVETKVAEAPKQAPIQHTIEETAHEQMEKIIKPQKKTISQENLSRIKSLQLQRKPTKELSQQIGWSKRLRLLNLICKKT